MHLLSLVTFSDLEHLHFWGVSVFSCRVLEFYALLNFLGLLCYMYI